MTSGRGLIAGVGQPWMRDLAFGSHVIRHLKSVRRPETVDVLDLSFNPITGCQMIEDGRYSTIVFVTARAAGRAHGAVYEVAPDRRPLPTEAVHAHVGDAVMGSVSLDTLLVLCRFRALLPESATVLEVEPVDESWGPDLTPAVQALVGPAADLGISRISAALS